MESFFSLLQKNVLDCQTWASRQELRLAIVAWIEGNYHRKRRQRGLGKLTPIKFETIMMGAVALATSTRDSTKPTVGPRLAVTPSTTLNEETRTWPPSRYPRWLQRHRELRVQPIQSAPIWLARCGRWSSPASKTPSRVGSPWHAGSNVLILGPVGVGKTHLATALGHTAIRRHHGVIYSRADKLFTRLRAACLENTLDAEILRLTTIDVLIIDDFALRLLDSNQTSDF
jgi:hypothetical protein